MLKYFAENRAWNRTFIDASEACSSTGSGKFSFENGLMPLQLTYSVLLGEFHKDSSISSISLVLFLLSKFC